MLCPAQSNLNDELREPEFNRKVDYYLTHGSLPADNYATCTPNQKLVLQCIKRSFARLTSARQ